MNPEINNIPQVKVSRINKTKILSIIISILIVVASVCAYFFYVKASNIGQDQNKINEEKVTALVQKINKIIDLPKGETPVLVVISDLSKLSTNPFFAHAKIGDDVLIYGVAKKAFIYDPNANMIVEAVALNLSK